MNTQINSKAIFLRVKAKHLAEEARIIRQEERKLKAIPWQNRRSEWKYFGETRFEDPVNLLSDHRKRDVRNEARATQLARKYIAGKPYRSVEPVCKDKHKLYIWILPRVLKMVQKYGSYKTTKEDIQNWVDGHEDI